MVCLAAGISKRVTCGSFAAISLLEFKNCACIIYVYVTPRCSSWVILLVNKSAGCFYVKWIALLIFLNIYLISIMPDILQHVALTNIAYFAVTTQHAERVEAWARWSARPAMPSNMSILRHKRDSHFCIQRCFSAFPRNCLIYVNLVYIMNLTNLNQ